VPLDVERESVRLDASYLSIVPRTLNLVEVAGAGAGAGSCANRSAPEASIADRRSTVRHFFMAYLGPNGIGLCNDTSKRVPNGIPRLQSHKEIGHNRLRHV
jgi:hypothetical protein